MAYFRDFLIFAAPSPDDGLSQDPQIPIYKNMNKETQVRNKLDTFLDKSPTSLKKLNDMVTETSEFPGRQRLLYNLMNLTNDVSTFSSDLIDYLAEDMELASKIVEKARTSGKFMKSRLTANDLKKSIQRLGYGHVHNEVQHSLARQYIKVYYASENQDVKTLIRKSVRTAFVAREMAAMLNSRDTTLAFFAGLNFYIGELVLALREPRIYEELQAMQARGVDAKSAQLAVLGFDLADLSTKMLEKWNLPDGVIDLVKNSADPSLVRPNNFKAAILLRFINYVVACLNSKKVSPQSMWDKAHEYMSKLEIRNMTSDKWVEEIKLLYIRLLETEYSLFQRK